MDHLYEWAISPSGIELTHAAVLLLTAAAAYLSYLSRRRSSENAKLLNGHLQQHVMDAAAKDSEHPGDPPQA